MLIVGLSYSCGIVALVIFFFYFVTIKKNP